MESSVRNGSTVNLCATDLSKAVDKANLYALFVMLMKRNIPVKFLHLLESMIFVCYSCVKWANIQSDFFSVMYGVRQGLFWHLFIC